MIWKGAFLFKMGYLQLYFICFELFSGFLVEYFFFLLANL